MRLRRFAFLVLLLLTSAWLDDGWAADARALAEDGPAAQDNEYIHAPDRARTECGPARRLPPPGGRPLPVCDAPGTGPARNHARLVRSAAVPAPALLYLLMSLQR